MPKRGRWELHPDLLRERSRHGVVRVADLEVLGIDSKTVYRKCLPGGQWRRLLPGVVQLHNHDPTMDQHAAAALLYAGAGAQITGVESCRRQGMRPAQLPVTHDVHLLIPHERKIRSAGFVTIERTLRLPKPAVRNEFPLAPLVRSTTDVLRRLYDDEMCTQVLIESIQRGRCTPEMLLRELNKGSQRGTAVPRRLLVEWTAVRSMAEAHAKRLSSRLVNPPSHWNPDIHDASGRYIACPDGWWDDVGMAWEIDSFEFHFARSDYARTLERNTRYAAAGIPVVQTLPSELTHNPADVLAKLEAAYLTAKARPRPAVHLARVA
ncbi:hypothetical protein ACGFMK_18675 [Amycolatopsis sp. NPDC049252]|uniref:hypothetical protein n=1 Tax=Amycolatopsis sp. NPDC049252 TaxID=3363933 RepID=UPI003710550F